MVNFVIVTVQTDISDFVTVSAALEVLFEAIVNTATIQYIAIIPMGTGTFKGIIMHGA